MPITAPRIVRFTLNGRHDNGHQVDTVLDYYVDENSLAQGRPDAIRSAAESIRDHWQDDLMTQMPSTYHFEGVSWVDLGSAEGETGLIPPNSAKILTGAGTAPAPPPNCAVLTKKVTSSGRGQKSGRMYTLCADEQQQDSRGTLTPGYRAACQDNMTNFLEETRAGTDPVPLVDSGGRYMVVTHFGPRPEGGGEDNRAGTATPVTALVVDAVIATQRRRLR